MKKLLLLATIAFGSIYNANSQITKQPSYDAAVVSSNIKGGNAFYGVGKPYKVSANIANYGSTTVSTYRINWSVDGGPSNTSATAWIPAFAGVHSMKIWADQLNGSYMDQNHANDTLIINGIITADTVMPKFVLFEEFNQASCDPCAEAKPNIDSVCANNTAIMYPIRYHVDWPGTDYMNGVTQTPFIGGRVTYYGVTSVPDGKVDGQDIYPGYGYFGSTQVQSEAAVGSPFKMNITSCTYNVSTRKFNVSCDITAYSAFAAGLKAQAVITVDTINYALNQSTETIPQTNFPEVAEDMMPNVNGTSLAAFAVNQTQTLNLNWTKNHPWGSVPNTHKYDSTGCHITIFVQDFSSKYVYQAASEYAAIATGIEELASGVYFELYPNPSNGDATIEFSLDKAQNIKVELFNMLGQNINTQNNGVMSAGQHLITIPGNGLQSGVYFVRFTTDNTTTSKKLIIQK